MDKVQERAIAIIDGTVAILEDSGWCQDVARDHENRMCMAEAVRLAAHALTLDLSKGISPDVPARARNLVRDAFRTVRSEFASMPDYNDSGITVDDVFGTLKLMREEVILNG